MNKFNLWFVFNVQCTQSTAKLVEPLDYENVIVKNKTLLQNDPQREMLLFPHDDLSVGSFSSLNYFAL